ncbi:MAG: ribosome biogenesis GTPase YlqF, partial [Anaeroplasmataceae bacterium]
MAKARREITEKLQLVDIIIELRDARIPYSSKNPMVDEIIKNKPRLIILNKSSMADSNETKKWIQHLSNDNSLCLDIDCIDNHNISKIIPMIRKVLENKITKSLSRGLSGDYFKALVLGIPNVGKSTFINTLSKRKAAKTGDKPGVTKGQSWIKISDELMLLDTPGILWPKFEDQEVGLKLSICGSIKDEVVDLEFVSMKAIEYLIKLYPKFLEKRY